MKILKKAFCFLEKYLSEVNYCSLTNIQNVVNNINEFKNFNSFFQNDLFFYKEDNLSIQNQGILEQESFNIHVLKVKNKEKFKNFFLNEIKKHPIRSFSKYLALGFEEIGVSEYFNYDIKILKDHLKTSDNLTKKISLLAYRSEETKIRIIKGRKKLSLISYNDNKTRIDFLLEFKNNSIYFVKSSEELKNFVYYISSKSGFDLYFHEGKAIKRKILNVNTILPNEINYYDLEYNKKLYGIDKYQYYENHLDKIEFLKENNILNPLSYFDKKKNTDIKNLFLLNFY